MSCCCACNGAAPHAISMRHACRICRQILQLEQVFAASTHRCGADDGHIRWSLNAADNLMSQCMLGTILLRCQLNHSPWVAAALAVAVVRMSPCFLNHAAHATAAPCMLACRLTTDSDPLISAQPGVALCTWREPLHVVKRGRPVEAGWQLPNRYLLVGTLLPQEFAPAPWRKCAGACRYWALQVPKCGCMANTAH